MNLKCSLRRLDFQRDNTYNFPCCQQNCQETEAHDNGLPRPLPKSKFPELEFVFVQN